jgi:hypothetical protein
MKMICSDLIQSIAICLVTAVLYRNSRRRVSTSAA